MTISINPGSGPVHGATEENATANIEAFAADLRAAELNVTSCTRNPSDDDGEGRFGYLLTIGQRPVEVQMPGLPLDQVRYVDSEGQDIWDFPRMYVDGSSWVWMFAVRACAPDPDDEGL
jgi:hypothetical protein